MVAHTFDSRQRLVEELCRGQGSLVYKMSSKIARTITERPCLKTKTKTQKKDTQTNNDSTSYPRDKNGSSQATIPYGVRFWMLAS